ncbi:Protein N-acetyltransferase, RimJ/RimL family [Streptosporangium subroseum]|uniref:Protein N-acetyltransferase, RimJ/RimL family n=1 Tax=Streptosporangium subroseum TaxID=106412 RepID=A0A239GKN6_9ACTN|nr:GNAT family N-acetyltransferase [Streptosporangium subroseum]SNS69747.1 Protein N-acetyltransferase, RimJ/RimL family [Streptosporangium subroseum]
MELGTERLVLRRWREEDLDPLAVIDGDPEVMRFIGDGSVRTREQTATALASMERGWDERGFGIFAVELRETGELAGWAGLAVPGFLPEVLPAVEIGWRLGRRFWGRGIATEAAGEALRFGFTEAGLDRIISICHVDHHASARVMEKLGMRRERETVVPAHGQPVRVLAITRGEFDVIHGG